MSQGSVIAQLTRESAKSLWPISAIFPFSGDFRRRLFSIGTEWQGGRCSLDLYVTSHGICVFRGQSRMVQLRTQILNADTVPVVTAAWIDTWSGGTVTLLNQRAKRSGYRQALMKLFVRVRVRFGAVVSGPRTSAARSPLVSDGQTRRAFDRRTERSVKLFIKHSFAQSFCSPVICAVLDRGRQEKACIKENRKLSAPGRGLSIRVAVRP